MTSNPYQPPSPAGDDPTIEDQGSRPLGVSILAVLHFVGGLLILALGVLLATVLRDDDLNPILTWGVILVTPVLATLGIATAVGLWRAKKWAWWLATFYYYQFVVGGILVLGTIAVTYFIFGRPLPERMQEHFIKHAGRVALFSALTWYMTKRSVFVYFGFQRMRRLRSLCILTGVILLLAMLVVFLMFMAFLAGIRP